MKRLPARTSDCPFFPARSFHFLLAALAARSVLFCKKIKYPWRLALLLSGLGGGLAGCWPSERPALVARVGVIEWSAADVALRARLNALQEGTDSTQAVAMYQLVRGAAQETLAGRYGVPLSDSSLRAELHRIQKNTLRPELLARLRAACPDSAAFVRVYIRPDFAQRWLYAHYPWLDQVHHPETGALARQLLTVARQIGLEQTARANQLALSEWMVSPDSGFVIARHSATGGGPTRGHLIDLTQTADSAVQRRVEMQVAGQSADMALPLIENVLRTMQPGELWPEPVEMPRGFWLLRYLGRAGPAYRIAVIEIPKQDFFQWLETELRRVPVGIADRALWAEVVRKVPAVENSFDLHFLKFETHEN